MTFSLNWCNPPHELLPDQIERIPIIGIDPETVTARDLSGEVVSRFKDDSWDCRAYGQIGPYYFASWWDESERGPMDELARTLTDEIKLIHWLLQNNTTANGGRSRGRAAARLVMSPLKGIAKIAHGLGITLDEAEHSAKFQVALKASIASSAAGFKIHDSLSSLLADLAHFQSTPNIECARPRLVPEDALHETQSLLKRMKKNKLAKKEQTPLIPARIFATLITAALEQLKALDPHLPKLETFIKAIYADPNQFCDGNTDWRNNLVRVKRLYPDSEFLDYPAVRSSCIGRAETLRRYGLRELFIAHDIDSLRGLAKFITHHQTLCVMLIHAFSGMRRSEVRVMPYEPVIHQAAKGFGDLPVFVSHLKKFEQANYSRALTWATSKEGVYAVQIAQQLGRLEWFKNRPANESFPDNAPLWISTRSDHKNTQGHYALPVAERFWSTHDWANAVQSLGLVIERDDIDELVTFDAFRDWDDDPSFSVGNLWPLTSHQFRRSVAVYASRSGMVSLPTLKTQYKHLSATMTAYYGENSSYAQSFLIDEQGNPIEMASILSAFRDEKHFNASLLLNERVIQASAPLNGPKGTEIQLAKDRGKLPKMLSSRAETEKAIKQGRLSYKETPVGGCMLKGVCPHFGIDVVLPCTSNCKDAVLTKDKLKTYVENLRFEQEMMSPKSKPYKAIEAEILHVAQRYLEPV
ncbi:MAG: hypothetical protein KJ890_02675 [Gammaproteobacteria bacterium]|nr:hypothetical protein [Gammaproteobacteria bacterium]